MVTGQAHSREGNAQARPLHLRDRLGVEGASWLQLPGSRQYNEMNDHLTPMSRTSLSFFFSARSCQHCSPARGKSLIRFWAAFQVLVRNFLLRCTCIAPLLPLLLSTLVAGPVLALFLPFFSFILSFLPFLGHSFIPSFVHSFIHSLIHSFIVLFSSASTAAPIQPPRPLVSPPSAYSHDWPREPPIAGHVSSH